MNFFPRHVTWWNFTLMTNWNYDLISGLLINLLCWRSFCYVLFCILRLHLWHMEILKLGVESELQLLAYTTATAMQDPSHVCDLHHSLQQHWILTHWVRPGIEPASSWILAGLVNNWATKGAPLLKVFKITSDFGDLLRRLTGLST